MTAVSLSVAASFEGWRAAALQALKGQFDDATQRFSDDYAAATLAALAQEPAFQGKSDKALKSEAMPFIKGRKVEAEAGGIQASVSRGGDRVPVCALSTCSSADIALTPS